MSEPPDRPHPPPPQPLGMPPYESEINTDPGRPHPYESLYRNPVAPQSQRPTPRHYEPSLSPPDGLADADDRYGWLFRDPDEPATAVPADKPAHAEDATRVVLPTRLTHEVELSTPATSAQTPHSTAPSVRPLAPPRRRRGIAALIVLLLLVAIGSGIAVAVTLNDDDAMPVANNAAPTAAESTAGRASSTAMSAVVSVAPIEATAECQAPPATDSAGAPVSYRPTLMLDKDPNTAWRCEGTAVGTTISSAFPPGTMIVQLGIVQLGLVNGYAKVDENTGAHLYGQYRRITRATWTLSNGSQFRQSLTDDAEAVQTLRIPVQETAGAVLRIDAATPPGRSAKSRDAVLISEANSPPRKDGLRSQRSQTAESRITVIGPSLTKPTCIFAPKTPVDTSAPNVRSDATKASTKGSLTERGAAALHDGRRPFRVSAKRVN